MFDESTGVLCQTFLVSPSRVGIVTSPADSRSVNFSSQVRMVTRQVKAVFPQQPGLEVAIPLAELL